MIIQYRENEYVLNGSIDCANAEQFEQELMSIHTPSDNTIIFDATNLVSISPAGLQVLIKYKFQKNTDLHLINVSDAIFDTLYSSRITQCVHVHKPYKEVDISNLKPIGFGTSGKIYQYSDETIIKIYKKGYPLSTILKERSYSQTALLSNVPTAVTYDIVTSEGRYGLIMEYIKTPSVAEMIAANPEKASEYGAKMGILLKALHSTSADRIIYSNKKKSYFTNFDFLNQNANDEEIHLIKKLCELLPNASTLCHGDFHSKNILVKNNELLLIDLGDCGYGHPILDFCQTYFVKKIFPQLFPHVSKKLGGMSQTVTNSVWEALLKSYFETEEISEYEKIIRLYSEINLVTSADACSSSSSEMLTILAQLKQDLTGINLSRIKELL